MVRTTDCPAQLSMVVRNPNLKVLDHGPQPQTVVTLMVHWSGLGSDPVWAIPMCQRRTTPMVQGPIHGPWVASTAPEANPAAEEDDVVMTALIEDVMPPPDSYRAAGKRLRSDNTSDIDEAQRFKKKDNSTTDGSSIIGEGPTNGVPSVDPTGFRKPDPPTS
uniref:Integrase core domain containing protein n=1 Tax=Solanum tuberosum TaxID=4113 RepID=M1DHP0_SOLTU